MIKKYGTVEVSKDKNGECMVTIKDFEFRGGPERSIQECGYVAMEWAQSVLSKNL